MATAAAAEQGQDQPEDPPDRCAVGDRADRYAEQRQPRHTFRSDEPAQRGCRHDVNRGAEKSRRPDRKVVRSEDRSAQPHQQRIQNMVIRGGIPVRRKGVRNPGKISVRLIDGDRLYVRPGDCPKHRERRYGGEQ